MVDGQYYPQRKSHVRADELVELLHRVKNIPSMKSHPKNLDTKEVGANQVTISDATKASHIRTSQCHESSLRITSAVGVLESITIYSSGL
jgi:hypothetical protein